MRHIRQGDENVTDHRYRSTAKFANLLRPTVCGAAPSRNDVSRADAEHIVAEFRALRPEWVDDLCKPCRDRLAASPSPKGEPAP